MTDVVLLGASGFVGGLVRTALTEAGASVRALRAPRLTHDGPLETWELGRTYADVVTDLAHAIGPADVVINAAGDPDASSHDLPRLLGANALLPALVSLACVKAGVGRFVHVSSATVQGRRPVLDETLETDAFSDYSRSKALGERLALECAPGVTTVYRPPSVHAPDRRVTRTLTRLAASPLTSVAGAGRPTPQALGANVGSAVAHLALTDATPPQVVAHPSEGLTTESLLQALGGRRPRRLPAAPLQAALRVAERGEQVHPALAANLRRAEMVWFGQGQADSWLTTDGWAPPVGVDGWRALGEEVRATLTSVTSVNATNRATNRATGRVTDRPTDQATNSRPRILFGVTTGIVVKSLLSGQLAMLREAGWDVVLVTTDEGEAREVAEREGATFLPIDASRNPSPTTDLRTLATLTRLLRRERPDVAVWGTPKLGLLGPLASRLTGTRSTYVLHGMRLETTTGLKRLVLATAERAAGRLAHDVVAVGHDLRGEAVRAGLFRPSHIRVLGAGSANGVPLRPRADGARARLGLPEGVPVVGFAGRVTGDKGIADLLAVWPAVHDATGAMLVLAGMKEPDALEGPLADALAATRGVVQLGYLADLQDLYSAIDVLTLPSYREGLPTVVIEAGSFGVPCVVSDATGVSEPVVDGETGLVVPVRDRAALLSALERLCGDADLRTRMGERAAEHVRATYSQQVVHEHWLRYYSTAAGA